MKKDNVKEATLALKDMLGISDVEKIDSTPHQKGQNISTSNPINSSKKKSKMSKNGKSKKSKEYNRQSKGSSIEPSKVNKSTSKSGSNQTQQKQNKKRVRTTKKGGQSDVSNSNYAWSAFQSPPDASTLPIPVFSNNSFS